MKYKIPKTKHMKFSVRSRMTLSCTKAVCNRKCTNCLFFADVKPSKEQVEHFLSWEAK